MKKRRKTVFKIIILGIFTILAVMTTRIPTMSPAFAGVPGEHAPDAMWIEPSTVDLSTDTVLVSYRFNVTVWINLTESSASWQFKLAYNKNHLNATGCGYTAGDKSQFFEDVTTIPLPPSFESLNTTHNYVLHAESTFLSPRDPGYGSLAWIEFEVMTIPPPEGETYTSKLAIVEVYPDGTETYAQDPDGNKIVLNAFESIYTIPEFPELLIPAVLMSLTLIAISLSIKLRNSKNNKMKITS